MPEQMMCPIRSDAKTVRHCQPHRCMWGRYYDTSGSRVWTCSATVDDDLYNNEVEMVITTREEDGSAPGPRYLASAWGWTNGSDR